MTYKPVQPHTKAEAELAFALGIKNHIIDALLGVTYYEEDWRWVQNACLALLDDPDHHIQWVAIQCLGHLATFHHTLDLPIVLSALGARTSDPCLAAALNDAFDDIATGINDTSYFEEHWDELPRQIKEGLIEGGIFNSLGKHVSKRNFVSDREGMIPEHGSRDHTLVERLKYHSEVSPSHDWNEYYDEQGNLLRLSLAELGLTHCPPELWQLTSLLDLDLNENQLSSLPVELGRLINLESLGLSENRFTHLPPVLGELIHLQELYLDTNRLQNIPTFIGRLSNLHTLCVDKNQLSSLPAELGELPNLVTLYLHINQLGSLPAEIGKLLNLRTLFLQENQLRNVPAELGQLVNLTWLSLDGNRLRSLPAQLGQLINLHTLSLSQNPQLQIPPPEIVQQGVPAILAYLQTL
ncbi:hypothetical protein [Ktedonospora formicarum]|uniref:Uncharacterized protein n=1 Tax=Ktedonospora formicarum TaxID=2778364 RepID=A0A8J3MTX3_9CHLR|nr:hypothetical protein [Ktedonospora formicarum]GHO46048.1 hypothetical protein KSX_42110 [Ktedonospora formicarum]